MKIFPAVDLLGGKAVRLYKGDYNEVTVYNENPLAVAKEFENKGFNLLTLFDSNGETSYVIKIHEGRLRLYNKLEEDENNE